MHISILKFWSERSKNIAETTGRRTVETESGKLNTSESSTTPIQNAVESSRETEFLAFMAHEIRNPLHAVLGLTNECIQDYQLLVDNNTDTASKTRIVAYLKENLLQILSFSEIMTNLATDARKLVTVCNEPNSGNAPIVQIKPLIHSHVKTSAMMMRSQQIRFSVCIQIWRNGGLRSSIETLDTVRVDLNTLIKDLNVVGFPDIKARLNDVAFAQMLSNIRSNAVKFTIGAKKSNNVGGGKSGLARASMTVRLLDRLTEVTDLSPSLYREFSDGVVMHLFAGGSVEIVSRAKELCGPTISREVDSESLESSTVNTLFIEYLKRQTEGKPSKEESLNSDVHLSSSILSPQPPIQLQWLQISIKDSGPGIPAEALRTLFQPFTQASQSCVIVVETREGFGTRFTFTVPLRVCEDNDVIVGGSEGAHENGKHDMRELRRRSIVEVELGRRLSLGSDPHVCASRGRVVDDLRTSSQEEARQRIILVVDDELVNQKIMVRTLRHLLPAHTIHVASNGHDAVRQVLHSEQSQSNLTSSAQSINPADIDIIFMDIVMPTMDSHEAAKILRESGISCPIIATTANANGMRIGFDNLEKEYQESGFSAVVGKPFSRMQIESLLKGFGVLL
ncbi:hypothetical protein HDU76_001821 [Blyttiomyces sp. JEL0837]|nr:hypothetical protein HDU76_001821 [Blyttiomyces sp. JEL0837]